MKKKINSGTPILFRRKCPSVAKLLRKFDEKKKHEDEHENDGNLRGNKNEAHSVHNLILVKYTWDARETMFLFGYLSLECV